MDVGTNIGTPAGVVVGGGLTYYGVRKITRTPFMQDVGSAVGATVGNGFSKLPVMPKVVGAFYGRRLTRTVIDTHMPGINPHLRTFLIDGVGADLGMKVRDPNKVLDSLGKHAKEIADAGADGIGKKWPKLGDNAQAVADDAGKLAGMIRRNGVRMINTAIGARLGRSLLGVIPVAMAGVGAVVGAEIGRESTKPPVKVPVEKWWDAVWRSPEERDKSKNPAEPEPPKPVYPQSTADQLEIHDAAQRFIKAYDKGDNGEGPDALRTNYEYSRWSGGERVDGSKFLDSIAENEVVSEKELLRYLESVDENENGFIDGAKGSKGTERAHLKRTSDGVGV